MRADSMARDDGGGGGGALVPVPAASPSTAATHSTAATPAPVAAPVPGQVYLPAWRRAYDLLVKMLRDADAYVEELTVERQRLIAEIQFLKSSRRNREELSRYFFQQIRKDEEHTKRIVEAETAVLLCGKDIQIQCRQQLAELAEDDLEDFKSWVSDLVAENAELKEKLKKVESQVESTDNSVQQTCGKDAREEIRKLKNAYRILKTEKDKEISSLQAEKDFVWNQLRTMEEDYCRTIKTKTIEVKQATEAAQKLMQNVDEQQVAAQQKDDEIFRLKERVSILENELQKMSLVKDKNLDTEENEDEQPDPSKMSKKDSKKMSNKDISKPIRKSKSDCLALEVTPDRREVKTTRSHASETNQKRKRSSFKSSLSCASTRHLQVKAAVSPVLLPPNFTVPRLKTPKASLGLPQRAT